MTCSVVIPVYNVAPYLRECLDSVLAQTHTEWKAICVDDGSTDGSGDILDTYSKLDSRFVVVHQQNKGVAAARNEGIDHLYGEYCVFIDSDDVLSPRFLEVLCGLVRDRKKIVGVVGWNTFDAGGKKTACPEPPLLADGYYDVSHVAERFMCGPLWNKIFPSSIFIDNKDVRFRPGLYLGEDLLLMIQAMEFSDGFVVRGHEHLYNYRKLSSSLSHGRSILECATCFWDDAVALNESQAARDRPELLQEWLTLAMTDHLYRLRSVSDCFQIAQRMRNHGRELWQCISRPSTPLNLSGYPNWKRNISAKYAAVIMTLPVPMWGLGLWMLTTGAHIQSRLGRFFNA